MTKKSLFCYFPQGFGSDAVCGPNLQCGPIWALTHFPVFYQNDLLWFSREIYIPTPVTTCFNLKVTINFACLTTEQIKENVGIAHFCQCISGTWASEDDVGSPWICATLAAATRKPTCIARISNSKRKRPLGANFYNDTFAIASDFKVYYWIAVLINTVQVLPFPDRTLYQLTNCWYIEFQALDCIVYVYFCVEGV